MNEKNKAAVHGNLATMAHKAAVEHGFWDMNHSNEHCMMLVIAEIAEMVQADRSGRHADLQMYKCTNMSDSQGWHNVFNPELFRRHVKDSVEDEMADVVIRLYDMAGNIGMDFNKYNEIRYYRDFDKFEFVENAFALTKGTGERIASGRTSYSVRPAIHEHVGGSGKGCVRHARAVENGIQRNAKAETRKKLLNDGL